MGQREKWRDRPDYRQRTIDYVLKGKTEFYRPPGGRPAKRKTRVMATNRRAPQSHLLQFNTTDAGNGHLVRTFPWR